MAKRITAPINSAMKAKNTDIAPKADIVVFVSCRNSNYNGDPDDEGRPRITQDGYGLMSAVSIKAKVRDTAGFYRKNGEMFEGDAADNNRIFVESRSVRTEQIRSVLDVKKGSNIEQILNAKTDTEGKENTKAKTPTREEMAMVAETLCSAFIDVRTFGQVTGTLGPITGPVIVENAVSANRVEIQDMCITARQVANLSESSKPNTMGRQSYVEYALFPIFIHVNPFRANETSFTRKDYENLLDILKEMYEVTNSSVRQLQFEKMFVFEHEKRRGSIPPAVLRRGVKVTTTKKNPTCFEDFTVTVDPEMLKAHPGVHFKEM